MASLAPRPAAFEVRSGRLPCLWDEELDRFYLWETGDAWSLSHPGAKSLVAGSVSPNADSALSTHTKFGFSWSMPDSTDLRLAPCNCWSVPSSGTQDERQPRGADRVERLTKQELHSVIRSRRV